MHARSVRYSLLAVVGCVLLAAFTPAPALAATCPKICNQKTIFGTGPESTGWARCECTTIINGVGSGSNQCGCGSCYQLVAGRVTGFAKKPDGSCPEGGTDCGNCDIASGSGSGANNETKTTAPPSTDKPVSNTPSPSLTSSAPSPSGASSPAADGKSGTAPANASTTTAPPSASTKGTTNDGLATWQIALIICSGVLVMAVVMMTITSCYCKTRNRMKDNMQTEEEQNEYEGYWNPNASGGLTERSGQELAQSAFGPAMTQGGRSSFTSNHSRPNSAKNMPYSEPTYQDDRIGAGMGRPPARQSLGSSGDLPGVFQPFPQRDRPSHEVGSRKHIAIEL